MLLWHVGATIAFVRYAFRDQRMDLRFLALGALLPEVIDTPIGILGWSSLQTVRLWSHGIVFATSAMVVVLIATRRGPVRKRWMLLAVGIMLHLLLDAMWNEPVTLWWPFLGSEFTRTGFSTFGAYALDALTNPVMWAGEVLGLVYLVALWKKSNLSDPDARRVLLTTGTVSAGIDRR
jgi:inner membrane protein